MEKGLHQLIVPALPKLSRFRKLRKYWRYHRVAERYRLSYRQFVAKVDAGTWDPYLAGKGGE